MTIVFAIRHPETTWNRDQRYQGRLNAPVSALGKDQAQRLVHALATEEFDVILSSPLSRARYLADFLGRETRSPVCVDHRLTEIAEGPWEGMTLRAIQNDYPELYHRWYSRPDTVTFPNGESLADVGRRSQSVLHEVFDAFRGGTVGLITHSTVVQCLAMRALGVPARFLHRFHIANCGITTLCGDVAPGAVYTLNNTQSLYGSPIASALAAGCGSLQRRRSTT